MASIGCPALAGSMRLAGAKAVAIGLIGWPLVNNGRPFAVPFVLLLSGGPPALPNELRCNGGQRLLLLEDEFSELLALLLMLSCDSELSGFELFIELDSAWPFGRFAHGPLPASSWWW